MNFFRDNSLFVPEEPGTPKGRSMVGYSRRSFFGLAVAIGVAAIHQEPRRTQTLAQLFDEMADRYGMTWGVDPAVAGSEITQVTFRSAQLFAVGQSVEVNALGEIGTFNVVGTGLTGDLMDVILECVKQPETSTFKEIWDRVDRKHGSIGYSVGRYNA